MQSAFVFTDETVLCEHTAEGWRPLTIALPISSHRFDDVSGTPEYFDDPKHPQYKVGCVPLSVYIENHPPADPSLLSSNLSDQDAHTASLFAISYSYAQEHHLALPAIIDADTVVSSAQNSSSGAAFIAYRQLIPTLLYAVADKLSQGIQLLRWQADTQFCSRCGSAAMPAPSGERAMICSHCRFRQYPRVQPCVITAITRPNPISGETQILLAHHHRYGKSVRPMQYGLIAGFVEVGESLEHAVRREVMEEVGITLSDICYVSSQPWPYPSNLMIGFQACYDSGDIVLQLDELSHADFFDVSNLPKIPSKGSIAYDLIKRIVDKANLQTKQANAAL